MQQTSFDAGRSVTAHTKSYVRRWWLTYLAERAHIDLTQLTLDGSDEAYLSTDEWAWERYRYRCAVKISSQSGFRTRRSELVDEGLIEDSGVRAVLASGRKAIAWQITQDGLDYLKETA